MWSRDTPPGMRWQPPRARRAGYYLPSRVGSPFLLRAHSLRTTAAASRNRCPRCRARFRVRTARLLPNTAEWRLGAADAGPVQDELRAIFAAFAPSSNEAQTVEAAAYSAAASILPKWGS